MPGYGYAEAPKSKIKAWNELIHAYLSGRTSLARVYVLIDARHGLKDADDTLLKTLDVSAVSYQIVLTKADQVKASELEQPHRRDHGGAGEAPRRVSRNHHDLVARRHRHAGAARDDRAADEGARLDGHDLSERYPLGC